MRAVTDIMDGMTNEEVDFSLRCYEQGLDAEDIYDRLNEEVPYAQIVELLTTYEDSLMQSGYTEDFY